MRLFLSDPPFNHCPTHRFKLKGGGGCGGVRNRAVHEFGIAVSVPSRRPEPPSPSTHMRGPTRSILRQSVKAEMVKREDQDNDRVRVVMELLDEL